MHHITSRRIRNRVGRGHSFWKVWAMLEREAEERQKEAAEREAIRQKETEEREVERKREAAERHAEWEKKWEQEKKEYEKQHKETERVMKELGEQMGGLHRSFGQMAEHLVAPGIVDRFNEMGFHIVQAAKHGMMILDDKKDVRAEIDLFMGNGDYIIAVEVKSKLGKEDIRKHQRRLEILREETNKTGDRRKILGGIAVAILGEGDKKAVLDAGFYLLVQSGDTMKIDLPEGFVPREW